MRIASTNRNEACMWQPMRRLYFWWVSEPACLLLSDMGKTRDTTASKYTFLHWAPSPDVSVWCVTVGSLSLSTVSLLATVTGCGGWGDLCQLATCWRETKGGHQGGKDKKWKKRLSFYYYLLSEMIQSIVMKWKEDFQKIVINFPFKRGEGVAILGYGMQISIHFSTLMASLSGGISIS